MHVYWEKYDGLTNWLNCACKLLNDALTRFDGAVQNHTKVNKTVLTKEALEIKSSWREDLTLQKFLYGQIYIYL